MDSEGMWTKLWRWFAHPVVGAVGTFTGILGIALSIWFYWKSVPIRELAIVEPPVRSVFLNRRAPAALDVRIQGEPVKGKDVFAVQFALWNQGNQSIRPENVLEPVEFVPQGDAQVVDAVILRRTRSLCGIETSVGENRKSAGVRWKILEPNDGAVIQLVLVGDQQASVGVQGTIEGGGRPAYLRMLPLEQPSQSSWGRAPTVTLLQIFSGTFSLVIVIIMLVSGTAYLIGGTVAAERSRRWASYFAVVVGLTIATALIVLNAKMNKAIPSALAMPHEEGSDSHQ